MTAVAGAEAARLIDTADVRLAVDVGGASGDLLHDLMLVNPQLEGVVFDLPHVALYLLRYILHYWDDEKCVRILKNCREALRPGGRVLLLEMILGEAGREPSAVPFQDLNMLVMLGGRGTNGGAVRRAVPRGRAAPDGG